MHRTSLQEAYRPRQTPSALYNSLQHLRLHQKKHGDRTFPGQQGLDQSEDVEALDVEEAEEDEEDVRALEQKVTEARRNGTNQNTSRAAITAKEEEVWYDEEVTQAHQLIGQSKLLKLACTRIPISCQSPQRPM